MKATDEDGEFQRRAALELQKRFSQVVQHGVGPLPGSAELAEDRLRKARRRGRSEEQAREAAIRRIVRESVAEAGGTGLVTGLGGFLTMPVTMPADLVGAFVINARMVGAIAHLRGYRIDDPLVQTAMQLVAAGVGVEQMAAEFGIKIGQQVVKAAIAKGSNRIFVEVVPAIIIDKIGVRAAYALFIRIGTTRTAAVLSRVLPFMGGLVGGTMDASFTRATGALAKKAFPSGT